MSRREVGGVVLAVRLVLGDLEHWVCPIIQRQLEAAGGFGRICLEDLR